MPKPKCPTEFEEQSAVVRWARNMAVFDDRLRLLHADSTGVRVPIGCAVKMKQAGAVKGWPDMFLAVNTFDFNGLFIEMKRETGGVVSKDQKYLHLLLRNQRFAVVVCRGANQAINAIKNYLGI
jgi:hypothetical protein